MSSQKEIFSNSEADAWFKRNKEGYNVLADVKSETIEMLEKAKIQPSAILEIGCAHGFRLDQLQSLFKCAATGIDPSPVAIQEGRKKFPRLSLHDGTADCLPFEEHSFDLVVFGFCLYLCDRSDLFKIAMEADRVLSDGGALLITDFMPPFPYKKRYSHHETLHSYKMDYSRMFLWNPAYIEISRVVFQHSPQGRHDNPDELVASILIRKLESLAYPTEPKFE